MSSLTNTRVPCQGEGGKPEGITKGLMTRRVDNLLLIQIFFNPLVLISFVPAFPLAGDTRVGSRSTSSNMVTGLEYAHHLAGDTRVCGHSFKLRLHEGWCVFILHQK